MTPEAQRLAIFSVCPFVFLREDGKLVWNPQDGEPIEFDPLNDLNAMHEAEKTLSRPQWETYCEYLIGVVCDSCPIYATAAQRAEAFLRTLNLWKD